MTGSGAQVSISTDKPADPAAIKDLVRLLSKAEFSQDDMADVQRRIDALGIRINGKPVSEHLETADPSVTDILKGLNLRPDFSPQSSETHVMVHPVAVVAAVVVATGIPSSTPKKPPAPQKPPKKP